MTLSKKRSRGFTLLELVVVLAIIVALAGIVVAKFDLLQLRSERAAAGATMTSLMRSIQTYRAVTNYYPDRWDSLLEGGVLRQPGPPGGTFGLDPGIAGVSGMPGYTPKLVVDSLSVNEQKSLARNGVVTILDHSGLSATTHYREGFTVPRTLDGSTASQPIAIIDPATTNSSAQKIIGTIYPQLTTPKVVPTNKKLVVLGLGKYCQIVGNNTDMGMITDAPTYTYSNVQYYDRYLGVFEVDANGGRSKLVAVLGTDGDLTADELAAFNTN